MPSMKAAAYLFDMDGTIADTDYFHRLAFQKFFASKDIAFRERIFEEEISGRSNLEIMENFFPYADRKARNDLAEEKEALFRELASGYIRPTPGVIELISDAFHHGITLCLVTNAPRQNAEMILGELELSNLFDQIVIADELEHGKPHPLPYLEALRLLGRACDEAIAFEDSVAGITSARGAGLKVVGVETSLNEASLYKYGASYTIKNFYKFDKTKFSEN